jgi:hypothetical protein
MCPLPRLALGRVLFLALLLDVSSPSPHPLPRLTLGHTHPFPAWFWDVTRRDVTSRLVLGCIVTPHARCTAATGSSFFIFIFALADRSLSFTCTWGPPPARPFVTRRPCCVAFVMSPCRVASVTLVVSPSCCPGRSASSEWLAPWRDTRFGPVADM